MLYATATSNAKKHTEAPRHSNARSHRGNGAGGSVTARPAGAGGAARSCRLLCQPAGPQHATQRIDCWTERVLGGGGEADDDAVAGGSLRTGVWVAHPREALQGD